VICDLSFLNELVLFRVLVKYSRFVVVEYAWGKYWMLRYIVRWFVYVAHIILSKYASDLSLIEVRRVLSWLCALVDKLHGVLVFGVNI
jgi:hypothetical protein